MFLRRPVFSISVQGLSMRQEQSRDTSDHSFVVFLSFRWILTILYSSLLPLFTSNLKTSLISFHKESESPGDNASSLKTVASVCGLRWMVIWPSTDAQGPYKERNDPGKSIPPLKHHLFVSLSSLIQLTKCLLYV